MRRPLILYSIIFLFILIIFSCKKDINPNDSSVLLQQNYGVLPDFSFVGYRKSEHKIPFVPALITLTPSENDRQNIQNAISELSKLPLINGFRGAIHLKAGTYYIDNTIYITTNGIVIRGEGQGENGTRLIGDIASNIIPNNIEERKQVSMFSFIGTTNGPLRTGEDIQIVDSFLDVGTTKINLKSTLGLQRGDTICIVKTTNDLWIDKIGMREYGWVKEQYQLRHTRVIEHVEETSIYIDIPLVDKIEEEEGGGKVYKINFENRLSNCGIENMLLESTYTSDEDELHMWTGIRFIAVQNSWVRNVTAKHFVYSTVALQSYSDFNTIQDCAFIAPKGRNIGDRRYAFYIANGMGNLFQRCYSEHARHDLITGARVSGPNVFLDCYAHESTDEIGPHHRWSTGILFDNIRGARLAARNRKSLGTGHGWTGAYIMFWNCYAATGFLIESPPGTTNWLIGGTGAWRNGEHYTANFNSYVQPRSFFIQQLTARIGLAKTRDILISKQLTASIWEDLERWRGDEKALLETIE